MGQAGFCKGARCKLQKTKQLAKSRKEEVSEPETPYLGLQPKLWDLSCRCHRFWTRMAFSSYSSVRATYWLI